MTDDGLWRMFNKTGSPFCFLLYKSVRREKQKKSDDPPVDILAFSGTGENPGIRF